MVNSVLITGASTGLGLETAVHLAEQGFEVYASMRDLGRRSALDRAAERRGVQLHVLQLDVTVQSDIERAVNTVVEQSGGIYALINNAGIGLRGYFEDLSDAELRRVFDVNVFGTMAVTRAVLPHMREARRGRVVVVTSVGARIGAMGVSGYCASRFAQEGFTESLAQEVQPLGIHVVLIEPALIKTDHWTSSNRGVAERAQSTNSPYYPWFQRLEALTDRLVASSPTTSTDVAETILEALTVDQPRLRYIVGRRASIVIALRRYLPAGLFERMYFGTAIRRVTQAQ